MSFTPGDRVRVARDRVSENFPRVAPLTGLVGTVLEVTRGALIDRVRVHLDAYDRDSWFHETELEIINDR